MDQSATTTTSPPANPFRHWAWPASAFLLVGLFLLRLYTSSLVPLDGSASTDELVAYVATPAGQKELGRFLNSLASTESQPLGRIADFLQSKLPDQWQPIGTSLRTSEMAELLNAMRVLDAIPPKLKVPHIPALVSMLEHPQNATIAFDQLQSMGKHAAPAIPLMLNTIRQKATASPPQWDLVAIRLAAEIAPRHPATHDLLATWLTNKAVFFQSRKFAITHLATHAPDAPRTRILLSLAANPNDTAVSSLARTELFRLTNSPAAAPATFPPQDTQRHQ